MKRHEFIDILNIVIRIPASKAVLNTLKAPPGRAPSPQKIEHSRWFNGLSETDKEYVTDAIKDTVDQTLFSFCVMLDGGTWIEEDPQNRGRLELYYSKNGQRIMLNDPHEEPLHDLFSEILFPPQ